MTIRSHRKALSFESLEHRTLLACDTLATASVESADPLCAQLSATSNLEKPRLIVLTDIGASDPDDEQSMVRLLTYANEFSIEGLIAGSHLREGADETSEQLIHNIVDQYEAVHPNFLLHDADYPSADELRSVIAAGQPLPNFFSDRAETDGSRLIIDAVDSPDPRPVNIAIWGGSADLAQALWTVRETRSEAELQTFVSKIRVAWIEQDNAAPWIQSNFPDLWVVGNFVETNSFVDAPFRGMYLGGDTTTTTASWVRENVNDHSPWGDLYPTVAAGAEMKEGDTPTWFYFLPTGLNDPSQPDWGGWGGRYSADGPLHVPAKDNGLDGTNGRNTVNRWRNEFQNDFEARMDWSELSFADANHNPVAVIDSPNRIDVTGGDTVDISAANSWDPDGDRLEFEWFQYVEVGSYKELVPLVGANTSDVQFLVPTVIQPETIHMVLKVNDDGGPNLFSYQRVVVTIYPPNRADIDNDGLVGFSDFLVLSRNLGRTQATSQEGDLNGDQQVMFEDFLIYSMETQTPAPLEPEADPPTAFEEFLVISRNFGSTDATADEGDRDGNGIVNFSDFLVFSRAADS